MVLHDPIPKVTHMRKLHLLALAALAVASNAVAATSDYFDSVKVQTIAAAESSIPATVGIGIVFIVIAIIVGLLMRSKSMGKGR